MIETSTLGWNTPTIECVTMVCILEGRVGTLIISGNWKIIFKVLDRDRGTLISSTWGGEYSIISLYDEFGRFTNI